MFIITCATCETKFERRGKHGPVPQFCSIKCKGVRDRQRPERTIYERLYRRAARAAGKLVAYERAYYQRPEVKERYRLRWQALFGDRDPEFVMPLPYTGHQWLSMAREMVGAPDPEAPWADDKYDEMGEAVLALLEGRDMKEAVTYYRKKEYVSRHLTVRIDEWKEKDGSGHRWFDSVMPISPSAEDVAIEHIITNRLPSVHSGTNRRRFGNNKGQSTPSNRKSNNK